MSSGTLERVDRTRSRIEVRGVAGHDRPGLLARSVTLNILGQAGSLVVGFVSSVLIARWLGPTDRGLLAIMTELGGISIAVVGLGLTYSALYYASREDTDRGTVLGVSYLDASPDSVAFVRHYHLSYPQLRDGDGSFARSYGTNQLPETFVIDRAGRVVAISRGEVSADFLARALAKARRS